jgi:hypothetical protein
VGDSGGIIAMPTHPKSLVLPLLLSFVCLCHFLLPFRLGLSGFRDVLPRLYFYFSILMNGRAPVAFFKKTVPMVER